MALGNKPYAAQSSFSIGKVGHPTDKTGIKDVGSHKPEVYSANYTKDNHAQAAGIHTRRAQEHERDKRPEQAAHHFKMAAYHDKLAQ